MNVVTIITRTLPATDGKPTRILAKFGDAGWGPKSATVAFDHARSFNENHFTAARKLWAEWSGTLDATPIASGDIARRSERVHLLDARRGEVNPYTGDRGGFISYPPSPDLS